MRLSTLAGFFLAGVIFFTPASLSSAPEPGGSFHPAVLLRLEALDTVISDLRYLAKEVGLSEEAKQIEGLLKARTGPKGLEGVDPKKPIGLYAVLNKQLDKSQFILLLPIADVKTFLAFLDNLDLKAEKDKDGMYTMQVPNVPFPFYFRIQDGYLHGTIKYVPTATLPAADKLPNATKVLAGGEGILSLSVDGGNIPKELRAVAVSLVALQMAELKDRELPGASEKHKALYQTTIDELSRVVKSVLESDTKAQLKLNMDRKTEDLALSLSLEGKAGSALAKDINSLKSAKSLAAGTLSNEAIMASSLHLALPDVIKKALSPALDEALKDHMSKLDAGARDLLKPLAESLLPTARAGILDVGIDIRGPGKAGKYTFVAALQIQKGESIEKALKGVLGKIPDDAKKNLRTDVSKVGAINIHQVEMKDLDAKARDLLGEGPLYFALRDDGLFLSAGEQAMTMLKEAVTAKAGVGQPFKAQISMARLAPLMKDQKAAPAIAKKVFTKKNSDTVSLSMTAGDKLEMTFRIKASVIAFLAQVGRGQAASE